EEEAAIVGLVVVKHRHRSRMPDLIRQVGLAHKVRSNVAIQVAAVVQDLDRDAMSVAMRTGENSSHPAHADQAIEPIATAQDRPRACGGAFSKGGRCGRDHGVAVASLSYHAPRGWSRHAGGY